MKLIVLMAFVIVASEAFSRGAPVYTRNSPSQVENHKDMAQTVILPGGSETTVIETIKTTEENIKIEVLPGQKVLGTDFSVKSSLGWIAEVARKANCVIKNQGFINEVAAHKNFDFTLDTPKVIASRMASFNPVVISTYCKKPLFGRQTNAYRNVGSNVIYFNTCIKKRSIKENVNTAVHERLHVVGYGHGDNRWERKDNSVNYGIGTISEKYVEACNQ